MTRKRSPKPSAAVVDPVADYRFLVPADQISALETELLHPLSTAIRINSLVTSPAEEIAALAARYGWQTTPVPFCPTGWKVENGRPSQTLEYKLGHYFIQDSASMLPVELFDFNRDSPLILDLAAAPGGKTSHIASRTGDKGLIVANDASAARMSGLRSVLQGSGIIHAVTTQFPGELFGCWYPDTFDFVLLDAPCSMENLRPGRDHPQRTVSPKERRSLAHRQFNLLSSAIQAARPGGQIVYSTCTLAPEEDESVIDSILKLYPGQIRIEDGTGRLGMASPGLSEFCDRTFDPSVAQTIRLWPHLFGTSGFFAALITKTGETPVVRQDPPYRPIEKTHLERLKARENRDLRAIVAEDYGFDLETLIDSQALSLWQRDGFILAVPDFFFDKFEGLPFFSLGLPLGQTSGPGFSPSREFAARFGGSFTHGLCVLVDELLTAWQAGLSVPAPEINAGHPSGGVYIVIDGNGRFLGRGKWSNGVLKNLF